MWLVPSSSGVLPTTIFLSANDSVRFSASAIGSPSAHGRSGVLVLV
jgi:hypothetical protein